jgi:hypothetical protein
MNKQEDSSVPGPAMSPEETRLKALKRFAISITLLNIAGHTVLGFETSVLQVIVCVATTYSVELILQAIGDWSHGQRPAFMGNGFNGLVVFLLPAHITGFAISMLLFAHDELLPFVLASAAAITSKAIFTVSVRGKTRHFLNPSNMGLVASILLYPTIGLAAPYQFTEHLVGFLYVALPLFILYTGSLLNGKLTKKMPLIFAWVGAFALQAIVRHFLFDTWLLASLAPMTGVPFVIYTFYMVTDPATSPSSTRGQIVFGLSLGAIYGILMALHQPFTLIVSLLILCVCRGAVLYAFEHGFMPKLRAFLDGQPIPARSGSMAPAGAEAALAGARTLAMPQPVPVHGAE